MPAGSISERLAFDLRQFGDRFGLALGDVGAHFRMRLVHDGAGIGRIVDRRPSSLDGRGDEAAAPDRAWT